MINYWTAGDGEPLVLLHGIGSRWQVWQPLLPTLAGSCRVIAVDLPGFGRSPAGLCTSVAALTERVADFLAEQGIERPHLAGNSMGGGIALSLAAAGLAGSVTAFSPIGYWSPAGLAWCAGSLRAMRVLGSALRPVLPALTANRLARTLLAAQFFGRPGWLDPAVLRADIAALVAAPGFAEALRSFGDYRPPVPTVPVTIAWGSRDALLPYPTQSRRARRLLPAADHVTLPGCGHIPFNDDPARCIRLILDRMART